MMKYQVVQKYKHIKIFLKHYKKEYYCLKLKGEAEKRMHAVFHCSQLGTNRCYLKKQGGEDF